MKNLLFSNKKSQTLLSFNQ